MAGLLHSRVAHIDSDIDDDFNRGTVMEYPAVDPEGVEHFDLAVVSWDVLGDGSFPHDGSYIDNVDIKDLQIVGVSIETVFDSFRDDIRAGIDAYAGDNINRDRALIELIGLGMAEAASMGDIPQPGSAPRHAKAAAR